MNLKGCYSHITDDWRTPSNLYNLFLDKCFIDCFPYQCNYDQLDLNYENKKLFINPPYSKLNDILGWLIRQIKSNFVVALLVPSRTDTKWFHTLTTLFKPSLVFIKGRLKFNDSKNSAPFPSMLMLFTKLEWRMYCSMNLNELTDYINKLF